jgi:uncharacterized protein (DUF58 family)
VLTRRGWCVCLASIALAVMGRLFGIGELYAIAVAGVALVGAALLYTRCWPWQVVAEREVRPPQVHADGNSRVELSVRNMDNRPTPVLFARDPFDGGRRWARFYIAPLEPGEVGRAAYRLPTEKRGIFPLGPLQLGLADPFGLTERTIEAAGETRLTVYPRISQVRPLPEATDADPNGVTGHPSLSAGGEDFYALRPYQTGDDLRRVHWPSTARQDELMIRQDELPWQSRVSVLGDLRSSVQTPASLELTLSAMASIIHAAWSHQRQLRLVTTDGADTGFGSGHGHLVAMLEYLAAAETHRETHFPAVLASLTREGTHGAVAFVTTDRIADDQLLAVSRVTARFRPVALVIVEQSAWDAAAPVAEPRQLPGRVTVIRVHRNQTFAEAWDRRLPFPVRRMPVRVAPQ